MTKRGGARSGLLALLGSKVAPPRFVAFLLLMPLGLFGWRWLHPLANWQDCLAMGFDLAAAIFLISLLPLLRDSSAAAIRRHARENDANRLLVLVITTVLTLVIFAAIGGELDAARGGDSWAMGRLIATLALIWLFANSVYALHYAHSWYAGSGGESSDRRGIAFPGTGEPDYADFAYFAFTLGMTFQTSDVEITAPGVRRVVLLHTFAAFIFNIGVIAFTINALGGR
jgi:uncharacterized membrane protein